MPQLLCALSCCAPARANRVRRTRCIRDPATDAAVGGFTKAKLARVCGSDAKAKNLFLAGATRVDPTLLGVYAAAAPAMPLVGTTFQGAVPVLEPGGSISMITAKWLVSAGSAAGKYKLAAKVSGRQVASELEATSVQSMVAAAAAATTPPAPPAPPSRMQQ